MSTTMLLLISGILIGAGVSLIWLDVYKRQRGTFVIARDRKAGSEAEPETEITVSRRAEPALKPAEAAAAEAALAPEEMPRPDGARPSAIAQQWAVLQPAITEAVAQVNTVLAGAGVEIGQPGEPSFSIDKAYGAPR